MANAMELLDDTHTFEVRWSPFLLRPEMPVSGHPKDPLLPRPGGGNSRVNPRMHAAGKQVGIDFTGKCDRYPNTVMAHVLLEFALEEGGAALQDELMEVLFKSYFTDGKYPDAETLVSLATQVGMDPKRVLTALNDDARHTATKIKASAWSRAGVSGVPFFLIDGEPAFSGAQDVGTFVAAFTNED